MGRLFWKIFFAFWVAQMLTAGSTGLAVWLHRDLENPEREAVLARREMLAMDLAIATLRHGGPQALKDVLSDGGFQKRLPPLYVVDSRGAELLGRALPHGTSGADGLDARRTTDREARAPSGEAYKLFFQSSGGEGPHPGPRPLPWIAIVMASLASVAVSALLAWYLTRPIHKLRWAFDAAANGRLETRVVPLMNGRRDEIADLGQDFDRMAAKLQSLIAAQKRLLHDVSHEFRSPLARLNAAVGLVRQDPRRLDASLARIERESARLDAMVGQVLTLARLESETLPRAERVDMCDLVAGIADDARFEANATARQVTFAPCGPPAIVRGSAELLHRAIENVVRNAVKYAKVNTDIDVSMKVDRNAHHVSVEVANEGSPLQRADLDNAFKPFYRGASGAGAPGFGLGLAIAHATVAAHGGTIALRNGAVSGLVVNIRLPLV